MQWAHLYGLRHTRTSAGAKARRRPHERTALPSRQRVYWSVLLVDQKVSLCWLWGRLGVSYWVLGTKISAPTLQTVEPKPEYKASACHMQRFKTGGPKAKAGPLQCFYLVCRVLLKSEAFQAISHLVIYPKDTLSRVFTRRHAKKKKNVHWSIIIIGKNSN